MEKMKTALSHCEICPRGCGINRTAGKTGWCHAPLLPKVALVSGHLWEEPPISGTKGSGTIFFSHCNLGCVFCQNHTISQEGFGQEVSILRLAEIFLEQQERGFQSGFRGAVYSAGGKGFGIGKGEGSTDSRCL